jgi:hypothetical protein
MIGNSFRSNRLVEKYVEIEIIISYSKHGMTDQNKN